MTLIDLLAERTTGINAARIAIPKFWDEWQELEVRCDPAPRSGEWFAGIAAVTDDVTLFHCLADVDGRAL